MAVSLNVPSFSSAVVRPGPLLDQHIQGRRNVRERAVEHVALSGERPGDSPQLLDGGDDVVPLLVEDSDEVVEAGEQIADLRFTSGQRDVEVVDDVADLSQPAPLTTADSDDSVCSVVG